MNEKHNGSGKNGSGENGDNKEEDKVIHFPTLAERDRIEREKREKEQQWQAAYRAQQKAAAPSFFNRDRIPPATGFLALTIIALHILLTFFISAPLRFDLYTALGFIPGQFTGELPWRWWALITPLTHTLLHGGWMHIGFNAIMLLALGTAFEQRFGPRRFIAFYALCAIGGAALTLILNPFSMTPVIGASGAISGLFAATILMFYEQGMFGPLTGRLARFGPWPVIGLWILIFTFIGILSGGHIAWQAHLGGFLTGLAIYRIL